MTGEHEQDHGGVRAPGNDVTRWDQRYAERDRLWSVEPNETVAEVVGPMTPGRALDLGAGEGRHALWLAQHGWRGHRGRLLGGRHRAGSRAAGSRWRGVGRRRRPRRGVRRQARRTTSCWSSTCTSPTTVPQSDQLARPRSVRWWSSATRCATCATVSVGRGIHACCTPRSGFERRRPSCTSSGWERCIAATAEGTAIDLLLVARRDQTAPSPSYARVNVGRHDVAGPWRAHAARDRWVRSR